MIKRILPIAFAAFALAACESAPIDGGNSLGAGSSAQGSNGMQVGANGAVPGSQQDLQQSVGDRVFFGYDQVDLSAEARSILEQQSQWLQKYPSVTVTVEGHADERSTREYNLALGARRAESVKNYLTALGVSPTRINTLSYGKERPALAGSGESVWAQNRRGVTTVN